MGPDRAEGVARAFAARANRADHLARRDYLARAMLRPLVELQRALIAEGEGATRHLVGALCGLDWDFPRIRCPACGETDPERRPGFHDERHAGAGSRRARPAAAT